MRDKAMDTDRYAWLFNGIAVFIGFMLISLGAIYGISICTTVMVGSKTISHSCKPIPGAQLTSMALLVVGVGLLLLEFRDGIIALGRRLAV